MKERIIAVCLFSVIAAVLFYRLGDLPLFDPDEPRYAQSAREMIERGSVLIPYFNGEPRLNKPILYYWTICAAYLVRGVSEAGARMSSALAALALFVATFAFARRVCGFRAAVLSCMMLGAMPLFLVPARLAMPDMLFSLWMILSLYCFYLGWQVGDHGRRTAWFFGFYAFQVVAAWTKGPVGILVPVAVAVLSLLRAKDRLTLRNLKLQWAIPAVLAASLPWYLYVYLFVERRTMVGLAGAETAGRMFGINRSYEPLYYYIPALAGGLFPWLFILPWAWRRRPPADRLRMFCETWFGFVFVFFSLCAAKKFQYIAMLSAVVALWLAGIAHNACNAARRHTGLIAGVFSLFCMVLIAGFEGSSWLSKNESSLLRAGIMGFACLILPLGAALLCSARGWNKTGLGCMCAASLAVFIVFITYAAPWFGERRSMRSYVNEHRALFERASAVYCASKVFNSLIFYAPCPVYLDVDEDAIVEKLRGPAPCAAVLSRRKARGYEDALSPFFLDEKYDRMLFSNVTTPKHGTP